MIEGPIEVGQCFIWEPHNYHARQEIRVTRIDPPGIHGEARIWSVEIRAPEAEAVWNYESRFREACERT